MRHDMWRSGTAARCIREASTRAAVYVDCVLRKVGEIVEPRDSLRRIIMSKNEVFTKRDGGLTLIGVEAMVCKILQVLQLEGSWRKRYTNGLKGSKEMAELL